MVNEIVRFAVEIFQAGAVIHGRRLVKWYTEFDHFHSKRILYPVQPVETLMDIQDDTATVLQPCAFVRISPIGITFTGPTDGVLDDILTRVRLDFFLGPVLPTAVVWAQRHAAPYKNQRTQYTWLGLFRIDPEQETGEYLGEIPIGQLRTISPITQETPR